MTINIIRPPLKRLHEITLSHMLFTPHDLTISMAILLTYQKSKANVFMYILFNTISQKFLNVYDEYFISIGEV
jgi:hypothetical protein